MNRRTFLTLLGLSPLSLSGCRYWPHQGFFDDCTDRVLPPALVNHELVRATWEGIDTRQVWDCHSHLVGIGDSGSGIRVNPALQSLWHPIQYVQFKFYIDATCALATDAPTRDAAVVIRLQHLQKDMPAGFRSMLLAFDYLYDANGRPDTDRSPFYVPNEYARATAAHNPSAFEWIASIHPYRKNAVSLLEKAIRQNARAVKWLPSVMGIDPGNPQCDPFYEMLARHNVPLLTHAGDEQAVSSAANKAYNNPLLLRRALEHGVRVIFAHCASLGESVDIDKRPNGSTVANIELFARLMEEPAWEHQVYGDISAITQVNRDRRVIEKIIQSDQWHDRLMFGSDYPLPGVLPLYSPENFRRWGMISASQSEVLSKVRRYNPLLFDVMLKRLIKVSGKQLSPRVFESRRHFEKI